MIDQNQILPQLFVGAHPASNHDIDEIQQHLGITAVLNLQTDEDMEYWGLEWPALAAHYRTRGLEVRRIPIRDFDPIDLRERLFDAVRALNQLLAANQTVYVHCTAGVGRAPAIAIAYLHWGRGWNLDEAVTYVQQRRTCSPSMEAIRLATQDLLAAAEEQEAERGSADLDRRDSPAPKEQTRDGEQVKPTLLRNILNQF